MYFAILVAAAVLSLIVWRSGNRLQDAIRADSNARIAAAQAAAASANERAANLEIEAAAQRERAALAERQLLELQERVRQRVLSDEQRAQMSQGLAVSDKCHLDLIAPVSDSEARTFMLDLSYVFENAGWRIGRLYRPLVNTPTGLMLVHAPGQTPACVEAISRALKTAGLAPATNADADVPSGTARLIVGTKTTVVWR